MSLSDTEEHINMIHYSEGNEGTYHDSIHVFFLKPYQLGRILSIILVAISSFPTDIFSLRGEWSIKIYVFRVQEEKIVGCLANTELIPFFRMYDNIVPVCLNKLTLYLCTK